MAVNAPLNAAADRTPLFALLGANLVSQAGNALTGIAVPWYVLETTGSVARAGLVGAATYLPVVLAGIFGGAVVDRLGFQRTSVVADVASGLTVAAIPFAAHTVGLPFWLLVTLTFLGALLDNPGNTARRSLVPDLAQLAALPLERANAAAQTADTLAQLAGPPLAGVLIVALGAANVLWLDAVSFAVSASVVAMLVPRRTARRAAAPDGGAASYLRDIRDGFAYLRRDRLSRALIVNSALTNFAAAPIGAVLLPAYSRDVYGSAAELGALLAALGIGTLLGTLLYGVFAPRLARHATYTICFCLFGAPFALLGLRPAFAVALALLGFIGVMLGPVNPIGNTVSQERVPNELRGRVFGLGFALGVAAAPLGMLAFGVLAQAASPAVGLVAVGAVFLVMTLNLAVNPTFRGMDAGPPSDSSAASAEHVAPTSSG